MTPFVYPLAAHVRRHGPQGYADQAGYRPWLRDEFSFRCIYCLFREQWGRVAGLFDLDHFLPAAHQPRHVAGYDDLLYSCATCNVAKGDDLIPDPCLYLLNGAVEVRADGVVEARTPEASRLVRQLGLDDRRATEFRLMWISIVEMAARYHRPLYQRLMGFPDDLPNLARLRPPGGNTRPDGIEASYYVKRQNGSLMATYH
jgi:hypothetical protein